MYPPLVQQNPKEQPPRNKHDPYKANSLVRILFVVCSELINIFYIDTIVTNKGNA